MDGDPTDNNAKLFAQGYNGVLKPKFDDGTYVKVGEPAGTWTPAVAATTFAQQYTAHPNINAVVTPNDDNANAVIAELQAQNIPAKTFPTTGQDASLSGLQNILKGYQCGTVYKPIYLEAQAAAAIALYFRAGQTPPRRWSTARPGRQPARSVPSVLLTPTWVTTANMAATVVKDKAVKASDALHRGGGQRLHSGRDQLSASCHRVRRWRVLDRGRDRRRQLRAERRCSSSAASTSTSAPSRRSTSIDLDIPAGQVTALAGDNGAGQVGADQVHRRHPHARRRRDPLGGPAGPHPHAAGRLGARHRDRPPGPRPVRQPRHRPEHVPRPGAGAALHPGRGRDGDGGERDAGQPRRHHGALGPPAGRVAVGRSAPVGGDRQGRAVELEARDHGRADRRARRGPDDDGARPRAAAGRPGPRGAASSRTT